MKLKELCQYLDKTIPLSFQESWDNSGLQVGDLHEEINSALLTIDVTLEVIEEAVANGCNLIVSHHPLIFSGLKRLTGQTQVEKMVMRAVREKISVYSAHTNLDSAHFGVSRKMAEKLGLKNIKVLAPLKNKLMKLVTFVPESHQEKVRKAIFDAGAGVIGNYDNCAFTVLGKGSFRAGPGTNPFVGETGNIHYENEVRIETILFSHSRNDVVRALLDSHPYEEVAYDLYSLDNTNLEAGMGCYGDLPVALSEKEFLELVSSVLGTEHVKFSRFTGNPVTRAAVCGGAGVSFLDEAIKTGADAFVTGDIKYHNFFDAEDRILLVDAGHFETEKFTTAILYDLIIKKFPKFAVRFSETNTNPINYL